jgi:5-formyltetrahydrofolate cyclo-ligase
MTSKPSLRRSAKERRAVLARSVLDFAARIADFAPQLPLKPGQIVAGYWPHRDEADPLTLMAALATKGHALALPCIDASKGELVFRRWSEGDDVVLNAYGINEPRRERETVAPALILVPLLAFDTSGHRLGYGGGYYDRTLAKLRAITVGIAYDGQEVQELEPEPHDRALDMIVTEKGLRVFG